MVLWDIEKSWSERVRKQVESAMSLASIYSARGKHEMAEPLLQQVLEWRAAGHGGPKVGAVAESHSIDDWLVVWWPFF